MGRFETKWLCRPKNLAALADLSRQWIDKVHGRRRPKRIVFDMASSESPTYGEQEGSAYNKHFGPICYHPRLVGDRRTRCDATAPSSPIKRNWNKSCHVVAKVEWHPRELCPRLGFIVNNLARPAEGIVAFYNQRGTAEQYIKEGKNAINWTRLSCRTVAAAVRPSAPCAGAYNFLRTLAMPKTVERVVI